jgi:hypothetical protein
MSGEIQMTDFTSKYNTELTSEEQQQFKLWATNQNRNISNEAYDYDIQGWWKNNKNVNLDDGHLTDKFKKPNHPTFSDQSQYHNVDNNIGGTWKTLPNGSYSFIPSKTNLEMFKEDELKDYFKRVEPGNILLLPIQGNPFQ